MQKRSCITCKKLLSINKFEGNRRECRECRNVQRRKENKPKKCQQCGKLYKLETAKATSRSRFCSSRCCTKHYNEHRYSKKNLVKICDYCRKEYSRETPRATRRSRFCSNKCKERYHTDKNRKPNPFKKCDYCKRVYQKKTTKNTNRSRFCSDECAVKAYKTSQEVRQKCLELSRRPDQIKRMKKWRKENREHIRKREQKRYYTNIDHKIALNLRSRINNALKKNQKSTSLINLLGCTIPQLKKHLEKHFKNGMTWKNHGRNGWHIDHIKPVTAFNLSDAHQQKKCFHYKNLQPLWEPDNIRKGGYKNNS